jgi:hypothetical protein
VAEVLAKALMEHEVIADLTHFQTDPGDEGPDCCR